MADDLGERIYEALGRNEEVDLPGRRDDFVLLAEFLARNPGFNTAADDGTIDKLGVLRGTDRDVYLPERDADLERLIDLLKRHDDVALLAKLLGADDPGTLLSALGHGAGDGTSERSASTTAAGSTAGTPDGDGGGPGSDDDEDGSFLDHEDLDAFGERIAWAAGGLVCLATLVVSFLTGFTVYKEVDSWVLTLELHDGGLVLGATAVAALVFGLAAGFVYRVAVDDVYDGYRRDLAAATFEVPLFGFVLFLVVYLGAPVVLSLIDLLIVDAVVYLVGLAIFVVVLGVPMLVVAFLAVGVVAGLPAFAGIVAGSLLGDPISTVTS